MHTDLYLSFGTLTLLEIILGIDNLIFIALLVQNLAPHVKKKARYWGIAFALIIRIFMLYGASWIMQLTKPLFYLGSLPFSAKDLLLCAGGIFLIYKTGKELYADIAQPKQSELSVSSLKTYDNLPSAIVQIMLIDFVFSFDSIITAVGMSSRLDVIIGAVIIAMGVMLFASEYVSYFLEKYPRLKTLALGFVLFIGIMLICESIHFTIEKPILYSALLFSLLLEVYYIIKDVRKK